MSDHNSPHPSARFTTLDWFSPGTWAVVAAVAFIGLVVAGVLPRISW